MTGDIIDSLGESAKQNLESTNAKIQFIEICDKLKIYSLEIKN